MVESLRSTASGDRLLSVLVVDDEQNIRSVLVGVPGVGRLPGDRGGDGDGGRSGRRRSGTSSSAWPGGATSSGS
jgi:hypothetical protein